MQANFYVIGLPPGRLVATEIDSAEAAVALDAGETLLLARPLELVRVALLRNRLLTICVREHAGTGQFDRGQEDTANARSGESSSPDLVRSRHPGFWRDWTLLSSSLREDRSTHDQPVLGAAVAHT